MRSFPGRFRALQNLNPSVLKEVHEMAKPSLFIGSYTGDRLRHKSMGITIDVITDLERTKKLQEQAVRNLRDWTQEEIKPPFKVEVLPQDWGKIALNATKKYGVIYTVLNMANAKFPGGSVLEGGCAQEENMWHRSTCPLTLLDKGVYLDKESNTFLYDTDTSKLIDAMTEMTADELAHLARLRGQELLVAYKVLLKDEPQICFRGPEVYLFTDNEMGNSMLLAESSMSFRTMPDDLVFPFFELRSAAPNLFSNKIDLNDKTELENYKIDIRRRIAAQLDTLILAEKSNAILGAWGCGSYKNDPTIVADIYREEIEKRAEFFDHIIFPIYKTDTYFDNLSPFKERLDGLKLGGLTPSEKKSIREGTDPAKQSTDSRRSRFFSSALDQGANTFDENPEKGPKSHQ